MMPCRIGSRLRYVLYLALSVMGAATGIPASSAAAPPLPVQSQKVPAKAIISFRANPEGPLFFADILEGIDFTLNPPRKGADESTRAAIASCAPRRVVYVSCDLMTLARDLDWFAARGYRPTRLQPFDMLPQTEHVECVALLEGAAI